MIDRRAFIESCIAASISAAFPPGLAPPEAVADEQSSLLIEESSESLPSCGDNGDTVIRSVMLVSAMWGGGECSELVFIKPRDWFDLGPAIHAVCRLAEREGAKHIEKVTVMHTTRSYRKDAITDGDQ